MAKLINIGFGNLVSADKIVAAINPDSAPIKRMVQQAKEKGEAIDATQGRRTKAVLFTTDGRLILSALQADTISKRFHAKSNSEEKRDMDES